MSFIPVGGTVLIMLYCYIVRLPKTLAGSFPAAVETKSSKKLNSKRNVIKQVMPRAGHYWTAT